MSQLSIGIVGLGRMGANMARRFARGGVDVLGFDAQASAREWLADEAGVRTFSALAALVDALPKPRVVWLMVPAGEVTEAVLDQVVPMLHAGDILVDGGNAFYRDSVRRGHALAERGIHFVDCGVSGGVWGLENGYALMFGGSPEAAKAVEPYARILAPGLDIGWLHCGPVGSGHFVKMVHNGIEYGMMQALAEGVALLKGKTEFGLDVAAITEMWRHGSVVRSWLLDLTADFLWNDQELAHIEPLVADSGEGRWTAIEAVEQGVPAPVMSLALMMRFASQGRDDYGAKLLAMMRKQFGGHSVEGKPAVGE